MEDNYSVFFSGGLDGTVKVWDIRSPYAVENLVGPLICGDTIDSHGNKLICGQWTSSDSLQCYDIRTYKPECISPTNRLLGSKGEYPYCCRFLRDYDGTFIRGIDGDLVMSGGSGCLEIISLSHQMVVWALPDEGNVVSVENAFPFITHASSAHHFTISTFSPSVRLYRTTMAYEESVAEEAKEEAKDEAQPEENEENEAFEGEIELEEEMSQKMMEVEIEAVKSEDPLVLINEIIVKYATRDYPTQSDRFKALWKVTRKRLLREWIKSKERYVILKQQANAQKENIHTRKHRWCEKNVMLKKGKDGVEVKIPLAHDPKAKTKHKISILPPETTSTRKSAASVNTSSIRAGSKGAR